MAQADPWDAVSVPVGQAPTAPAPPRAGGVTTRTLIQLPDPNEAADNARADRSEARQQANSTFRTMTDAEAKAMGLPAGGVYQINGLGEVKTVKAAPSSNPADATEGERKAAAFLIRALGSNRRFEQAGVGPRSLIGQTLKDTFPNATNYFTDGERQAAESAQDEFIAASLRQDSGAAIPEEELERQRRIYFPMPGDGPEVLEQKRQARLRAIAGLEQSAGRLLEPTLAEFGAQAPVTTAGTTTTEGSGQDTQALSALDAALRGGASEQDILALAQRLGITVNVADLRANIASRDAGGPVNSFVGDQVYPDKVSAAADRLEAQLGEAGLIDLAKQGITLGLSDEAGGIGAAIGQMLGGDFNVADNYAFGVDVERELLRRARERTGGYGTAAELIGGGGAVRTIGNMGLNAGRALAASGQPVTRAGIQGQMVRDAARDGAMVGGVAGFGYGEGAEESLAGGAVGAGGGALLGNIMQRIANRRAGRRGGGGSGGAGGNAPITPGGEVIQSADRFNAATGANVQPLPADTGGTLTRRLSGGVAQSTFGARPIVEAAQSMNDEAQAGIRALANRQGNVPQSRQSGGETAIRGAEKTMKREKMRVDALYAKARREAGGAEVDLPMARTVLQAHIDELSRTPGGAEGLSTLQALANDIGNRRFPIDGIKSMRSQLRDRFIKDGLRGSDLERRVNEVIDAADLDIEDGLVALGKRDAAQAYAEASRAAADRFTLIDDVLAPVLGRKGEKSGEQAFAAIEQLSRGDAVTLGKFMRALPDEEAGSVRGILIDRLGRVSKGRQDASGEAFSLNDFLTRWNDEGLSKEAKAVLFDGETRAALDDLARVAQGTKEGQRFANFSNTGGANWVNTIVNGAPVGVALLEPFTALAAGGASVATQFGLGRLLASPKFARWLAKLPKQPNEARAIAHIRGLEKIAAADAAIAADLMGLQRQLLGAFGPSRVLAGQETPDAGSDTTGSGTQ